MCRLAFRRSVAASPSASPSSISVEASSSSCSKRLIGGDRLLELGALAHDLLRGLGIVPEVGILGLGVQFGEAALGGIPVKDASSAVRRTA